MENARECTCGLKATYKRETPLCHKMICECGITVERRELKILEYVWNNRTDSKFGGKTVSKVMNRRRVSK